MEKIFEILAGYWETFKAFQILTPTEGGVHLRAGFYFRTLTTGVYFKVPIVDLFLVTNVAMTTVSLPTQTISDKIVSAIVKYQIVDTKKYLLEWWDAEDVIQDVVMGAIRFNVEENPEAKASEIEKKVLPLARKEVRSCGIQIKSVTFTDFGKVRSLRIILDSMSDNS